MSGTVKSYLPVPEICEYNLTHSFKQPHKRSETKPPKLNPKHDLSFNRSLSSSWAHTISFCKNNGSYEQLFSSPIYNKDNTTTYFDECFDVLSKIGEGSFGEVFKVRCREDGLLYAVKKSKQFFRSEKYRQERLEEVKRYEQFSDHEHCVTLYKAWEQEDRLYMQMELCECSLENYIADKKYLSESTVWYILLDLLLALKSLHDRNLIHLDIKLDNILISEDASCKLADFGLVVDVDQANRYQATEGDCRYIAPELLQGIFSKAADIFSLGIAILEVSCNLELPPNGPLWQQLRGGILPAEFIQQISPELRDIITSMMAPDPLQRPTVDMLLMNQKLQQIHQSRKRWRHFRKINQSIRKVRRYIWTKLCNFQNIIKRAVFSFLTVLRLIHPSSNISDSSSEQFNETPVLSPQGSPTNYDRFSEFDTTASLRNYSTCNRSLKKKINFPTYESMLPDSPSKSPNNYGQYHGIVNSTPLRDHNDSLRALKKKISFVSDSDEPNISIENNDVKRILSTLNRNEESCGLICRKILTNFEDSD